MHRRFYLLLPVFSAFLMCSAALSAQTVSCSRVGWVAAELQGCGVKLIDLDNGALLHAATGADGLQLNQTVSFSYQFAPLPANCLGLNIPVIDLTCVSAVLPCVAQFGYATNTLNSLRLTFQADIYDDNTQTCTWNFGDGSSSTGSTVEHTFSNAGSFQVCLTLSDNNGCNATTCKTVLVSDQNPNSCGYEVLVTSVDHKLYGELQPLSSNAGQLLNVQWYHNKSNEVLSTTPEFQQYVPSAGNYFICAQYQVADGNSGLSCTTTRCVPVSVTDPSCTMLVTGTPTPCPTFVAPVCGCNGVTYANECEAMSAGVQTWWAGECSAATGGSCGADLNFKVVGGNPSAGFDLRFFNHASGDFTFVQLDFGDGSPIYESSQWDSVEHHFPAGGIFRVNLTAWKTSQCVSSVTRLLLTDSNISNLLSDADGTDYVRPGDANGDKKANVRDLLNLGVGYNTTGAPRPFATTAWTPQFAPNWPAATGAGVNYKHLDCDGNGFVNDADITPIQQHFTPLDTMPAMPDPALPPVWIEFAQDSITLNIDGQLEEIEAEIHVGTATRPAIGLKGLSFSVKYPEYLLHNPVFDYSDDSFFGFTNEIFWLPKDVFYRNQIDMGLARRNGTGSGYGAVAKVKFKPNHIIIVDIIDRAKKNQMPLAMRVSDLHAIDANGNELQLAGADTPDTLWIKLPETIISTSNGDLQRKVIVSPNPTAGPATLYSVNLKVRSIDVVNALGQPVRAFQPNPGANTQLNFAGLAPGLYGVRVQTEKGLVEKRVFVSKRD